MHTCSSEAFWKSKSSRKPTMKQQPSVTRHMHRWSLVSSLNFVVMGQWYRIKNPAAQPFLQIEWIIFESTQCSRKDNTVCSSIPPLPFVETGLVPSLAYDHRFNWKRPLCVPISSGSYRVRALDGTPGTTWGFASNVGRLTHTRGHHCVE